MAHNHIFITGGASGIGEATVKLFNQRGWKVTFSDIDVYRGQTLARSLGENVLFIEADTRNRDSLTQAVATAVSTFGPLGALFANAGIHQANTLLDISDEDLHKIIDINIYGTVNSLQAAVPALIAAKGGAIVINCSDQWFVGKPHSFAYGLTKGALGQITRSLAIDLGPHGIRVNAICAGTIHTPLVDNLFEKYSQTKDKSVASYWEEENAQYMRGEAGRPEEVAEMVYFLASDASSFCTGGHYLIDGGLVAQ